MTILYSSHFFADFLASSPHDAQQRVASARARELFGPDAAAWDVSASLPDTEGQTFFACRATLGPGINSADARQHTLTLWVAGTHRHGAERFEAVHTLAEALRAQKKAAITGEPRKQPVPGTMFGYARILITGAMKCVGMIARDKGALYARHFAGLLDGGPQAVTCLATGSAAFLVLVPECLGDQTSETVARLAGRVEYSGGSLFRDQDQLPLP